MIKIATLIAFVDEIQKQASLGLELGGLGVLAAHPAHRMLKGKSDAEDKTEVAGLGILGAGSIMAHKAAKAALTKKAADMWNPETGARSEETKVRGSVLAKQQKPAIAAPLKSAASIRGAPFPGAAKAPISTAATAFKPRMASLGKVVGGIK